MSRRRSGLSHRSGIRGIGNHRVPNYELPSKHPRADLPRPDRHCSVPAPGLDADNDVVIALTHIGSPEPGERGDRQQRRHLLRQPRWRASTPSSAATGHTNPASGFGLYIVPPGGSWPGPTTRSASTTRTATTHPGEVIFGLLPTEVAATTWCRKAGRYITWTCDRRGPDPSRP